MVSYAAADCHFRQDAHRRMASVIARIRRAEERDRGERAQDHQCVNGEKLLMSLSSADCTEVEYATELYSGANRSQAGLSQVVVLIPCGVAGRLGLVVTAVTRKGSGRIGLYFPVLRTGAPA
jgi:hypothetical protein